jgi:hypothetical protein
MRILRTGRSQIVTIPSITVGVPYQNYGTPTVMEGMSPASNPQAYAWRLRADTERADAKK